MFRHYLSGLILFVCCLFPWSQTLAGDNAWTLAIQGSSGCGAFGSYAAAYACRQAELEANDSRWADCSPYMSANWEDSTPPSLRIAITHQRGTCTNGYPGLTTFDWVFTEDCASLGGTWDHGSGSCIVPYDCEDLLEESSFFLTVPDTQNGFVCSDPNDGHDCAAQPVSMRTCADGNCSGFYRYTGEECLGGFDVDFEDPPDQEPDVGCVSGGGVLACFENEDMNCGTVNGERVCLDSVPSGQCVFLGSGGMVCASDASAPPAPTESDGTTPATPDGEFSGGPAGEDPADFDYYGPGTVSGSGSTSTGAGQGGAPQGNAQSGEGEFEFPDGTASASSDCSVAPTCDGHNLMCGIIVQNWHSACQDIPSESEFLTGSDLDSYDTESLEGDEVGLGAFDASGFIADECLPDMVLDLGSFFGTITFPFSAWCDLFTWIGMLVLAAAGLMSIRIVVEGL